MAKIFWVDDQSHWIDKFQGAPERADLDGGRNTVMVYRFSAAARQQIALTSAADRPDIALLDARMNGNDRAGFSVSATLLIKVVALNVTKLRSDNVDPRDYMKRLDDWEKGVYEGGGLWSVVNDLDRLDKLLDS